MAVAPPIVSDGLWERIEPLPPKRQWHFRYPHTVTSRDMLRRREADNVIFPAVRCHGSPSPPVHLVTTRAQVLVMFFTIAARGRGVAPVAPASAVAGGGS